MICLKHCQQYNSDEFCLYCGNPYKTITSSTTNETGKIDCKCWCHGLPRHEKDFKNLKNAVIEYNKQVKILHGQFAVLNRLPPG